VSSLGFTKVRVPPEKRPDDMQTNILDQTRIHLRNYDHVYKLVTDCLFENQPDVEQYKQQQAVNEIIKNPEKLKEFAMGEYKDQIKAVDKAGIGFIFDQIIDDLMHPFMDFREDKQILRTPDEQRFSSRELFYSLIDETERTFRAGMIVSATVVKIYDSNGSLPPRILCRLENGLDASIGEQDADFFPGA
jgi:transcriptional accessory protein Tex/SPT6